MIYIKNFLFGSVLNTICDKRNIDLNYLSTLINVDKYYLKKIVYDNNKCNKKVLERVLTNLTLTEKEIRLLKYSYYLDNETLPRNIIEYIINNNILEKIEEDCYSKNNIKKLFL